MWCCCSACRINNLSARSARRGFLPPRCSHDRRDCHRSPDWTGCFKEMRSLGSPGSRHRRQPNVHYRNLPAISLALVQKCKRKVAELPVNEAISRGDYDCSSTSSARDMTMAIMLARLDALIFNIIRRRRALTVFALMPIQPPISLLLSPITTSLSTWFSRRVRRYFSLTWRSTLSRRL